MTEVKNPPRRGLLTSEFNSLVVLVDSDLAPHIITGDLGPMVMMFTTPLILRDYVLGDPGLSACMGVMLDARQVSELVDRSARFGVTLFVDAVRRPDGNLQGSVIRGSIEVRAGNNPPAPPGAVNPRARLS